MTIRGIISVCAATLLQLLLAAPPLSPPQTPSEYEVKAAFLLNFVKFVEWPEGELRPGSPLSICVIGDDPFGKVLDQVVEGESLDGHKIAVVRRHSTAEGECHVAYFGKALKDPGSILTTVTSGVLTVGEDAEFLRGGGMVAFVVENRRVRFDVSMPAMRRAGVRASSRLLRVARAVKQ